jgi:hypothetical protein
MKDFLLGTQAGTPVSLLIEPEDDFELEGILLATSDEYYLMQCLLPKGTCDSRVTLKYDRVGQ